MRRQIILGWRLWALALPAAAQLCPGTGFYRYDGADNVKQIGTQDFRYDRYQRLISGEVTVSGVDRVQSATYDVYNNLLSLTTNGSTLTTSVNGATNRLTSFSATYDAAGNLTRQIRGSETHQYTYDPLGMLKNLQSPTDQAPDYHFHPDHLGTPRQITNASGVQVALHREGATLFSRRDRGREEQARGG